MNDGTVRVSHHWLALREAADAAARASDLVDDLRPYLPAGAPAIIHDLGCGTGAMGRWLAPRLAGAQHWVLHDHDPGLLARAATTMPGLAADGTPVTVETRRGDVTRLPADALAGAALTTASALLDMLTADELDRFVRICFHTGGPVLVGMTVTGRVELSPADELDGPITAAFNDHQRREIGGRRLIGPDAVDMAVDTFRRLGAGVRVRPSPWLLGADQAELAAVWFTGWVRSACEQRPGLRDAAAGYVRRRLAEVTAGGLSITVHHHDLLALPG